jgi:hemolysin activation/secretion protein
VQFGDRAVAASAEWRFPLALVERGRGLLPVYLDRVWGTLFVDAGRTWCSEDCLGRFDAPDTRAGNTLASAGAELGINLSVSYLPPVPVRVGVGVPLRPVGAGEDRPDPRAYLTVGLSF